MEMRLAWPSRHTDAVGTLRILLVASIVVPILLFIAVAWIDYRDVVAETERDLGRLSEIAREHALKVFDTHRLVAEQVDALVGGRDERAIRASQRPLHDALRSTADALPQIMSILVIGADGHPLVASGRYPFPTDADMSDRDYFKALKAGPPPIYISSVQERRVTGGEFFGLARRREAPDGGFGGVIDVAVSPSFFATFYAALLGDGGDAESKAVGLVRDDGQVLVSYPSIGSPLPKLPADHPFFAAIAQNPERGLFNARSLVLPGAPVRFQAYRRIPGYPLYTVVGRTADAVMDDWRRLIDRQLLFGLPLALGLVSATAIALRRTKREMGALAQAQEEIRRREAAEEALLQAHKLEAVGQLTAGVAHDFNNLLTVILGNLEFMAETHRDDPRAMRRIDHMQSAADRGARLTAQLLAFSRKQKLHAEPVDLNQISAGMGEMLRSALGGLYQIEVRPAIDAWPVLVDRNQLELVLLNLAINARDAMEMGGALTIAMANLTPGTPVPAEPLEPGDYVVIAVSDTGTGMPPEIIARAFEPFFTTKEVGKGAGLGLSQVYGFARQSGGGVRIDSEVGKGTTVRIYLPRAPGVAAAPAPEPVEAVDPSRKGMILVVDDDPAVRAVTAQMCADLGFAVVEAGGGAEALARWDGRATLAVIDYAMPGMNGGELARQLRARKPTLPILLVTGFADSDVTDTTLGAIVLCKPFRRDELSKAIDGALALDPTSALAAVAS
jgi:signal transduction histidine kinase/CheY-like chemotaxis protein